MQTHAAPMRDPHTGRFLSASAEHEPPAAEESEEQRRARAAAEEKRVRDEAEAATAHLPRPGMPGSPPLAPSAAGQPGEATVKMLFPRPVFLTLTGYRVVRFEEGIQEVPASLADDDYLRDSGAKRV